MTDTKMATLTIEMPESCAHCPIVDNDHWGTHCGYDGRWIKHGSRWTTEDGIDKDCPLVELEPHLCDVKGYTTDYCIVCCNIDHCYANLARQYHAERAEVGNG